MTFDDGNLASTILIYLIVAGLVFGTIYFRVAYLRVSIKNQSAFVPALVATGFLGFAAHAAVIYIRSL